MLLLPSPPSVTKPGYGSFVCWCVPATRVSISARSAATLAHHLHALVQVGLVTQQRQSRQVINHADYDAMNSVLAYVAEECCTGVSLVENDAA